MKAFISYSHNDYNYLTRLHVHLATLKREGKIDAWYDRKILAGARIDKEIQNQLNNCELFLALVSPDFLASNYCYEQEMEKAIKLDEIGKMRVVPIILEPCDWLSTPLKEFKAIPRDGKAISEWTNQNTAFLDVVTELRKIVDGFSIQSASSASGVEVTPAKEGRRYKTQRDFDNIDKADFKKGCFEAIKNYMKSSIAEINGVEEIKARFSENGPTSFSCTIVNRAKDRGTSAITVHMQNERMGLSDIYYSNSENASANTSNGGFRVEADEYTLFLQSAFSFSSSDSKQKLTALQAADMLWEKLMEQAGVSYA